MDGIPALDLRVLVIEVFHSSQRHTQSTGKSVADQHSVKYVPVED